MFWGDNATYTGRLYYDNLASLPTLYVESNAGLMLKGSDNAYISSNNLTSVGGKYTSVSGTRSTSLGNSNSPTSLYGNSLDINGVTGASGSISWVDTTQRKAFGLGVTKGIVTYINAVDY